METREEHYASMMQAITRYAPSADLEVIQRAYEYADEKHKNQLRKSGEPYIIHPLAVAEQANFIGCPAARPLISKHDEISRDANLKPERIFILIGFMRVTPEGLSLVTERSQPLRRVLQGS